MIHRSSASRFLLAALLLLAGSLLRAEDYRFGILRVNAPGKWYLNLCDKLAAEGSTFSSNYSKYPFYSKPELKNDFSLLGGATKGIEDKAGTVALFKAGEKVKEFTSTGQDCEIEGNRDYVLGFPYNLVGIKSFKRVFELYSKTGSTALIAVESKVTGSAVTITKLAQADYDEAIGKFKAGKTDAYKISVQGTLYTEASKAAGNLIEVTPAVKP